MGGGRGAARGAGIGAGIGALSGAAEANARAQGYYGPPPGYGPPPSGYYGPPGYGARRNGHSGAPNPAYPAPSRRAAVVASNAPPPLPVYEQPLCPGPGYAWTPGHWAYAAGGYYWVPGTWVLPPAVGLIWTPGYWGMRGSGTFGMPDIGGRTSATMAVSITAWVISDPATKAATGKAARSSTIPPLRG